MTLQGRRIRNIRLIEPLGRGGMGEVWLGFDEKLGRHVAVKAIHEQRRLDDVAKTRLLREAQLLSRIDHPGICRIHDFVEDEEADFIVLEHVDGRTLSAFVADRPPRVERVRIALGIADALAAAHALSVVHRDLKPDNVMVDATGVVRVLDFGLARPVSSEAMPEPGDPDRVPPQIDDGGDTFGLAGRNATGLSVVIGTPRYMSPEQARGEPTTAASDVYSFGLLLQELLTGAPPYDESLEVAQVVRKAMWGDHRRVRGVHPRLAAVVDQMTAFEPADRPTAADVAARLRSFRDRGRRRARRAAGVAVVAALGVATVLSYGGLRQSRRAFEEIRRAQSRTEAVNSFLRDVLASPDPRRMGIDVTMVDALDRAAGSVASEFADDPVTEAAVREVLGTTFSSISRYQDAEVQLRAALALYENMRGGSEPEMIGVRNRLGEVLIRQGRLDEAAELSERTLRMARSLLGEQSPRTLTAMRSVAVLLTMRGRAADAEPLFRKVLDTRRRILGTDAGETLTAMSDLANCLYHQGRVDEAGALHEEAIVLQRRVLGEEHPYTLATLGNLGNVLLQQGRYGEAEAAYRELLEVQRRVLGDEHSVTLQTVANLGVTREYQDDLVEAEGAYRQVLEARRRILGPDHPATQKVQLAIDTLGEKREPGTRGGR